MSKLNVNGECEWFPLCDVYPGNMVLVQFSLFLIPLHISQKVNKGSEYNELHAGNYLKGGTPSIVKLIKEGAPLF